MLTILTIIVFIMVVIVQGIILVRKIKNDLCKKKSN